jgi:phosphatidylserine/phosphatidylglycerophosphate/cardiolipin synthase-like enzyme
MRPAISGCLLILTLVLAITQPVFSQASLTAAAIPNAIADGGGSGTTGYPYAVFVRIQGWTAGASGQAYLKIYSGGNNEWMWTGSSWSSATPFSAANQPVVTIDASGGWSGWIYAKHNTNLGTAGTVRAAKVGATSTNLNASTKAFTILNMTGTGNGGWIVRTSSPAVNKGILAYAGGAIVGSYRTEDNGITEGYSYGAGGFKIAVPAGVIDSLVVLNDDGSRNSSFAGPWIISAGQETDASSSAGAIGHGTVSVAPAVMQGMGMHTVTLTVRGESPYVISHARALLPARWSWSRSSGDVAVTGAGSSVVTIAGDTIVVSGLAVGGSDSAKIVISNVAAPDTTASFVIGMKTGTHTDSVYAIAAPPSVYVYGIPLPISTVKVNDANGVALLTGTLTTVRGVVTVSNQLGVTSFIQDNTGGIGVYGSSSFSNGVALGDEVIVSGVIKPYSGLCEIFDPIFYSVANSGNAVDPVLVTAADIQNDGAAGIEQFEGRLVRINNAIILGAGTWSTGGSYSIVDGTDTTKLYINANSSLVGTPIPVSACDIVGVVSQHVTASPFIGGYEILPRGSYDIISAGPVFATAPIEKEITPQGLHLSWTTVKPGTSRVRYGTTGTFELGIAGTDTTQSTSHDVALTGLTPATIYHVQAFSVAGADTSTAGEMVVSTASPASATGAINVYFNKSVSTSFPSYVPAALGNQSLTAKLLARMGAARTSIDAAFYSLNGSPGTELANALIAARGRGVSVRVIFERDNDGTPPQNALATSGVPLIYDDFDPVNAGAGLMHNKFVVIDGRGAGKPDSIWVWTGSWNPTDGGTNSDFQNAIEIQDPALAGAYTVEFNEMWGSGTETPNKSLSRFGARKTDNTPHRFVIGGHPVSCYFSPSDHTTAHILDAVNAAQGSIYFALLLLTRTDLANALLAKQNAGIHVLGVIDSKSDQGQQYDYLTGKGMDIRLKTEGGLLHHKYAVLSADWGPNWDRLNRPTVITGSHNWSNTAENSNNENTLIVQEDTVAMMYMQEFAARYVQFGGTGSITVDVEETGDGVPATMALQQNYPNPFNPTSDIRYQMSEFRMVRLSVYDLLGREVAVLVNEQKAPGSYTVRFNAAGLASGVFFCRMVAGPFVQTRKMLLVR